MTSRTDESADRVARGPSARQIAAVRRAGLAAFVLLVVQYGIGIGINLYVTVPAADHGHGLGQALSNGPAAITVHIVVGLLVILAALGLVVQAIIARKPLLITISVVGLAALLGAAVQGASFVNSDHPAASMAMGLLTGVALLCYGVTLYVLPSPR